MCQVPSDTWHVNVMRNFMHILLLFPHYNSLDDTSGLRSRLIAEGLAAAGHRVTVFAPGVDIRTGATLPGMGNRLFLQVEDNGVTVIRPRSLPDFRRSARRRLAFEALYALLTTLRALFLRDVDVVVASCPPALVAPAILPVVWLRRWPAVYEVRDLFTDYLDTNRYVRIPAALRLARALDRLTLRCYRHFIAISPGVKRHLVARGVPEESVAVVPNGYLADLFAAPRPDWDVRERFGWGDRFVVIYAGGLTQSYDVPTLLRAAEKLRDRTDILFVLMGSGDRRQEYMDFCADQHLDNVQILDPRPRREMPHILSAANVGASLFRSDPLWSIVLNNKLFDYLGSGLPVLYGGTGDSAALLQAASGGIVVPPEDVEAVCLAILYLRDNPAIAREMGRAGQAYVRAHYEWSAIFPAYLRALEAAVMQSKG